MLNKGSHLRYNFMRGMNQLLYIISFVGYNEHVENISFICNNVCVPSFCMMALIKGEQWKSDNLALRMSVQETVGNIKLRLQRLEGIPRQHMHLPYRCKISPTLDHCI